MISLKDLPKNQVTTIPLTAIIDSALCVGAGGSDGSLADKPIIRNAQGQLLIPASQLKGRLRHECEKIADALGWPIFLSPKADILSPTEAQFCKQFREKYNISDIISTTEVQMYERFRDKYTIPGYRGYHCFISQVFGNPTLPSRIIVDDLICPIAEDDLPEVLRSGVTINRRRRTSEEKKLYFLETSPVNNQLEFTGSIHLLPDAPKYTKPLILATLRHVHALGGSKSAGLGWLRWKDLDTLPADHESWKYLLPSYEKN